MQYSSLVIAALAAAVAAQSSADPTITAPPIVPGTTSGSPDLASLFGAIAPVLPPSLLSEAATNPAAVYSEIAADFARGSTPAWFSALPTDIQSFLAPPAATALATASASNSSKIGSAVSSAVSSASSSASAAVSSASSVLSSLRSSASSAASSASSTSTSTAGASAPTAIIGAGIAGAIGVIGLLAL